MKKIKVWGVKVYVMGADRWERVWFSSEEERNEYYNSRQNPCEKLRCRLMEEEEYKEHVFARTHG